MKKFLYLFCLYFFLIACSKKDSKTELSDNQPKTLGPIQEIVGIGKIQPENDIIQLSAPVNGIVQQILKKENDSVNIGTPILVLQHQVEDAKVNQMRADVKTQRNQIIVDRASTEEFEAKYNNATSEVQRLQRLLAKGAETQQAVDDANTNLKSFQSNLKRLQAGVFVSESKVKQSEAALQIAEIEKDQKTVKAPVKGKLLELTAIIGGYINTQDAFAQIAPQGKTIAICEIDELYANKVTVGQKAFVRTVGSLDTLSKGLVYFTSSYLKNKSLFTQQAGEKEDRRVRTIKILLDKPDKLLLNARVECVINLSDNLKR